MNVEGEAMTLEEAFKDVLAHLVAAHSLLERSPKTGAASNKMFDQMLADYAASIERGRAVLAANHSRAAEPVAFHWYDGKYWSKWMDAALHNDLIRVLKQDDKKIEYAYTHPSEPVKDAEYFRYIVENNWIGVKTRIANNIQDGNIETVRIAIEKCKNGK